MNLTVKQTRALEILEDDHTTELLYGGGAGGGKSALGCYWQLKRRLMYPGTRGLIGRSSLSTLKETTLNSFFEVAKMQGLQAGRDFVFNQQSKTIKFSNGSEILLKDLFLYPSDPNFDELGSLEITDAFIDECNQVVQKAWQIVKSRIRYKLDENGLIPKMMGSCNPAKTWVYTYFYKPHKDGELAPNRAFVQSLLTDNKYISKHYRENLLSLDLASKERLLHGNWEYDNDPSKLIDYDNITNCFSNDFVPGGKKYITADIARFGSDNTVIILWDGFRAKSITSLRQSSVTDSAQHIKALANQNAVPLSHIVVDEDGVGGGVKDILKCKGFVNNSAPLNKENYANLKSQCYFKLADRIQNSGLYISTTDPAIKEAIIQELEQVKQKDVDKDGKKAIIPKEQIKDLIGRSPDYSDALMMREYFELGRTGGYSIL